MPKEAVPFIGYLRFEKHPARELDKPESWQFTDQLIILNFYFILKNIFVSANNQTVHLANLVPQILVQFFADLMSILSLSLILSKAHFQVSLKMLI